MSTEENPSQADDSLRAASDPQGVHETNQGDSPQGENTGDSTDRRDFLAVASTVGMAGGIALGYGKFAELAGRYLYPPTAPKIQLFVSIAQEIKPGGAIDYITPDGVSIVVTRKDDSPQNLEPPASDFLALSSVCPHLGCRVHWEPHNDRFFCPCHNGVFDPSGKPVEGPPKDENQELGQYELVVENGLLFIMLPTGGVQSPDALPEQVASKTTAQSSSSSQHA